MPPIPAPNLVLQFVKLLQLLQTRVWGPARKSHLAIEILLEKA